MAEKQNKYDKKAVALGVALFTAAAALLAWLGVQLYGTYSLKKSYEDAAPLLTDSPLLPEETAAPEATYPPEEEPEATAAAENTAEPAPAAETEEPAGAADSETEEETAEESTPEPDYGATFE